jgi:hypothetical protein
MSRASRVAKFPSVLLGLLLAHTQLSPAQEHTSASGSPPDVTEQNRILDLVRQYADGYINKLPNFTCFQTIHQFEAGKKPSHWHEGDTLTSRLIYNRGKEDRSLELVNNKPLRPGMRSWRTPLTTEGEFGILISNIVDPVSQAKFSWNRWAGVNGHRVAVFDYSIAQEHSTLSLSLSNIAKATLPYSGSVYADPQTGAVWKITSETADIPEQVRTRSIATTIEYGEVNIAGIDYVLPVTAQVSLVTPSNHIRNEMRFAGYRKFEAESTISFSPPQDTITAKPADAPKTSPQ